MKRLANILLFVVMLTGMVACNKSDGDSSSGVLSCDPSMEIRAFEGLAKSVDINCENVFAALYVLEDEPVGVEIEENQDKISVASTVPAGTYIFRLLVTDLTDGHQETTTITLYVTGP